MITKEQAARIWYCYEEIENSEKMLEEMKKSLEKFEPNPEHNYRKGLELGIPNFESCSKRLYKVNPEVALAVLVSHIASQKRELQEINQEIALRLHQNPEIGESQKEATQ